MRRARIVAVLLLVFIPAVLIRASETYFVPTLWTFALGAFWQSALVFTALSTVWLNDGVRVES